MAGAAITELAVLHEKSISNLRTSTSVSPSCLLAKTKRSGKKMCSEYATPLVVITIILS
jgi:hypothetical protein